MENRITNQKGSIMRIKVEFDNNWSFKEIEEYLKDMENEKYKNMDFDLQVELAACTYIYTLGFCKSQNEMVSDAAADVADGIEEFFFDVMWKNYVTVYNDEAIEEYKSKNVAEERSLR